MKIENPSEILTITSWRGIAAITVASHNFFNTRDRWDGYDVDALTRWFYQGHLFVDFFFLLSGFILSYVYFDRLKNGFDRHVYREFIIARFARIYPIHVLMVGAFLTFEVARFFALLAGYTDMEPAFESPNTLADLFFSLSFLTAFHPAASYAPWNGPAWSIGAEWWSYLAVPFGIVAIGRICRLQKLWTTILSICICSLLYFAIYQLYLVYGTLDLAGLPGTIRCALQISIGITIFAIARELPQPVATSLFLLGIAWCVLAMHLATFEPAVLPAFALIVCGSLNCNRKLTRPLTIAPLVLLGRLSFALYMVHYWVMWLFVYLSNLFDLHIYQQTDPVSVASYYAAFMSLSLFLGYLIYSKVEEPMRHVIRRVFTKRP